MSKLKYQETKICTHEEFPSFELRVAHLCIPTQNLFLRLDLPFSAVLTEMTVMNQRKRILLVLHNIRVSALLKERFVHLNFDG